MGACAEKVNNSDLERERILSENTLTDQAYDFQAKFMAVWHLQSLSQKNPEVLNTNTISILEKLLMDSEFSRQTQAYFMYKEVANTLCAVIIHSKELAEHAFETLKGLLGSTQGHPHRAAAEALGSLPFSIHGPKINEKHDKKGPFISWSEFLEESGHRITEPPQFIGRSLVARPDGDHKLLVIKFAHEDEPLKNLISESQWMAYLNEQSNCFSMRFNIPEVLAIKGSPIFRLRDTPISEPKALRLHQERYALGFMADEDYFSYPNDIREENQLDNEQFKEVMSRNAWILGRLASLGIVHSSPIPLFHNRVQRVRRRDHGLYEWFRAGRLDRWLESCLYPNLGLSGVRDFEHLVSFEGKSNILYRHIGVHILSLLLVMGSFFRNKDRNRIGFDSQGMPVDARDLFDKAFFKELIFAIFENYYLGFVSETFQGKVPIDLEHLSSRMIDEMGVDRHMEEILRPADQDQMTNEQFQAFLGKRGFSMEKIRSFRKGAKEIIIYSGPHLGEFNHPISIPELIEAVGTMASLCIAGRYCLRERNQS